MTSVREPQAPGSPEESPLCPCTQSLWVSRFAFQRRMQASCRSFRQIAYNSTRSRYDFDQHFASKSTPGTTLRRSSSLARGCCHSNLFRFDIVDYLCQFPHWCVVANFSCLVPGSYNSMGIRSPWYELLAAVYESAFVEHEGHIPGHLLKNGKVDYGISQDPLGLSY